MEIRLDKVAFWMGTAALALGVYLDIKQNQISSSIDVAVENLSRRAHVDVERALVERAVRQAVDLEVSSAVRAASVTAVRKASEEMRAKVREAVRASYGDMKGAVSRKIAAQAANIDMKALTEDVTEKAKEAILEKFDGNLDQVLDEFKKNLGNVAKIYESIAGAVSNKSGKEYVFRIA